MGSALDLLMCVCVCVCVSQCFKSWLNCLICCFWMRYLSEIFLIHSLDVCTNSYNFFCMSVSLLFSLLLYWNYTNIGISTVLDDIYIWIFLERFLGCLYTFSKCLKKLYVCQLVSCLTSLLKLGHCRDMSYSGLDIYLIF